MLEQHEHDHAVHEVDGIIENRVSSPPVYFTVLFYGLIVWAIVFMAFYLFSGWSSETEFEAKMAAHQQQQNPAAAPAETTAAADQGPAATPPADKEPEAASAAVALSPDETDPAALFADHCAMCHGADAGGGFGSDLTAAEYEYGKSREAIFTTISRGQANNKMPGFEGKLKRQQIYALADYLLTLGEPAAPAQAAVEVPAPQIDAAGLFAQHCAMCHGADASGGGIGPDLTTADYSYGKSRDKVVESITSGRPNGMPAFGKQLQTEEISALADYLLTLGQPAAPAQAAAEAPGSADKAEEPAESKIDAAGLFAQRCAMCHGANGAGGGIGPDLTAADYIYGKSQDKVVESIANGRSKGMPAFGKQLQAEEISALAQYVREL